MTLDLDALERATRETVERATEAYIRCALWSSVDDNGEPLDNNYGPEDLEPSTLEQMREDVYAFLSVCWGDTWKGFSIPLDGWEPEEIGHDLWLTRNGHGAGFWDRGRGEIGDRLTELAKSYGGVDLYVTDSGEVAA